MLKAPIPMLQPQMRPNFSALNPLCRHKRLHLRPSNSLCRHRRPHVRPWNSLLPNMRPQVCIRLIPQARIDVHFLAWRLHLTHFSKFFDRRMHFLSKKAVLNPKLR